MFDFAEEAGSESDEVGELRAARLTKPRNQHEARLAKSISSASGARRRWSSAGRNILKAMRSEGHCPGPLESSVLGGPLRGVILSELCKDGVLSRLRGQ